MEQQVNPPRYQPKKTGFVVLSIVFAIPASAFVGSLIRIVAGAA